MSIYIHKAHNVSVLIYHIVCPAKYRKAVFSDAVDQTLKEICLEIAKRYEIHFLEVGADQDHVHFLVQSVPTFSPTKIVRTIKSITAREIFRKIPSVKKDLWGVNSGHLEPISAQLVKRAMKLLSKNMSKNKAPKVNTPNSIENNLSCSKSSDTSWLAAR